MYAVVSKDLVQLPPGAVVRIPGSWQDYCMLRDGRRDGSIPRIKYHDGEIFLMSPLPRHGREANILADIVKVLLDNQNQNYEAFTPITMELPDVSGIEPDYCFYIDNWQAVVGKDRINWGIDPPPDLVIEIDVTSYTSVDDYLPYGVPEFWLFKKGILSIYRLESGVYQLNETSLYFPEISLRSIVSECLQTAKDKGTGIAISQLRQQLSQ
jgi:Uma2 family endonuclease